MNRLTLRVALAALLATPGACSTLVGHEESGYLMEMTAEGARVTYSAPAHCQPPGYSAEFHPGAGVAMTILPGYGGGVRARFRVELDSGKTFGFVSTSGRAEFPTGAHGVEAFISNTSWTPGSRAVRVVASADSAVTGQAPSGDHSLYEGEIGAPQATATAFTLQFPDTVVNGTPFRFPPIHFTGRRVAYFQDACLR